MVHPTIANHLGEQQLTNLDNRNGWAIGTVALKQNGHIQQRIEEVFIELLNRNGVAPRYGGLTCSHP